MIWTLKWSGHPRDVAQWWIPCLDSRSEGLGLGGRALAEALCLMQNKLTKERNKQTKRAGEQERRVGKPVVILDFQEYSSSHGDHPKSWQLVAWAPWAAGSSCALMSQPVCSLYRLSLACPGASLQQTFHFVPGCPWLSVQTPPPAGKINFSRADLSAQRD